MLFSIEHYAGRSLINIAYKKSSDKKCPPIFKKYQKKHRTSDPRKKYLGVKKMGIQKLHTGAKSH